jgi:hypothetical protein
MTMKLYKQHSSQIQSGDLIEWRSSTALGGAIRMFTRKRVNHSSIAIRPKQYAALRDRRFVIEALSGGLVPRLLSARLKVFKGQVWWAALKPSEVTDEQRDAMAIWAILETVKGTRYDYGSLFGNMFSRVNVDASRWFCSEAYTAMLQSVRLASKKIKARRPGEFGPMGLHIPPVLIYDNP